ncbi:MAG: DUF3368 domain-containing protein [Verrucomicrobiae bacterium]|nr:DUF3368 domain-containing protein [Verrucomicrobiae bacterium]
MVCHQILVPRQVSAEILVRGQNDVTAKTLTDEIWLKIVDLHSIPPGIIEWGLGQGETSVIALGINSGKLPVIIDDYAGRKCALSHGLSVSGTLGIILRAKKQSYIPLARPVLEEFLIHGLYLSRATMDRALALVGE